MREAGAVRDRAARRFRLRARRRSCSTFEDFAPGQKQVSGTLRVDAAAIKAFAAQFDPQPFHLNEDAARGSFFGGLAASGWHTAALTMRLLVDSGFRYAEPGRRARAGAGDEPARALATGIAGRFRTSRRRR